ncbi:MAG: DNA-3-methyladenine glycosidase [Hyphomicrobiales bacterium]|nr:MAG: DNA-3-methyladenine glycosidase [Hyphomicrobiales bacterium]
MKSIRNRADIEEGLEYLGKCDPLLLPIIEAVEEVPLRLSEPGFKGLASIIVSQQVSKASAAAIFGRLCEQVSPFTAENYLAIGEEGWRIVGLSRPKQRTFVIVCNAIVEGQLNLTSLCELPVETAMEQLTALKGIGPWTAEVYLLFCAGHRDIFPAGDLALQEAVRAAFDMSERPTDKKLRTITQKWSPWQGVAARLFWAYYAVLRDGRDGTPA